MKSYQRSHLADETLVHHVAAGNARLCDEMADHLADLGEFDARKLYLPAGYPSTFSYCVHELHLTRQSAFKRIYVARKARRFPTIFHAIADGRLHLSGVVIIGRHLTEATAAELLAVIEHKTCEQIERIRADRFPQPDLPTVFQSLAPPEPVAADAIPELSLRRVQIETPVPVLTPSIEERPRITPLSPGRSHLHTMIDDETTEKLRYAQALLAHLIPTGDMAAVLKRVIDEGVMSLEKQKLGSADAGTSNGGKESRHIPTAVRREV